MVVVQNVRIGNEGTRNQWFLDYYQQRWGWNARILSVYRLKKRPISSLSNIVLTLSKFR